MYVPDEQRGLYVGPLTNRAGGLTLTLLSPFESFFSSWTALPGLRRKARQEQKSGEGALSRAETSLLERIGTHRSRSFSQEKGKWE